MKRLALLTALLSLALSCKEGDPTPDGGTRIDVSIDGPRADVPDTGTSPDLGDAVVSKVLLLGVTTDKEFKTNGRVRFTVMPTNAKGGGMISKDLAVAVAAATPAGLASTVESKEEKRPVPGHPLITGLLFDSSGSMSGTDPLRHRVEAGKQFIDQLDANDQVAVADFGAGNTIGLKVTRLLQDFTTDKTLAKAAMSKVDSSGDTPMFESVSEVLVGFALKFPAANNPNRALVVLGDGEPTGTGTLLGSCTVAATTKIPVSTVGFGPASYQSPQANLTAIWNLGALAGCSGGTYSSVPDAPGLSKTYVDIGQLLKKGSVVISVSYQPVPTKVFVTGTLGVGNGSQTPVEVKYTFYAP